MNNDYTAQIRPFCFGQPRKISTSHLLPQTPPTNLLTQIQLKYRKRHPQSKQQQNISRQYS
ncbi:hypothetical protein BGZ91_012273 [Linnemannia elongata]|nr:hypothetical protein BGZ91_012273 [Linnemannia elongata]